jgi:hypothetical protein
MCGLLESSFMSFFMEILRWKPVRLKLNSKGKCWNRPFSEPKSLLNSKNSFNAVSKLIKMKGLVLLN